MQDASHRTWYITLFTWDPLARELGGTRREARFDGMHAPSVYARNELSSAPGRTRWWWAWRGRPSRGRCGFSRAVDGCLECAKHRLGFHTGRLQTRRCENGNGKEQQGSQQGMPRRWRHVGRLLVSCAGRSRAASGFRLLTLFASWQTLFASWHFQDCCASPTQFLDCRANSGRNPLLLSLSSRS